MLATAISDIRMPEIAS